MDICKGKTNGVKCKYFDEDFNECTNKNRSHIIKEDLKSCKYFKGNKDEVVQEVVELQKDVVIDLIEGIVDEKDEIQRNEYSNFISLKPDEQKFVFYVMVQNMDYADAVKETNPKLTTDQAKRRASYLKSKKTIVNALNEFSRGTIGKMIEISGVKMAQKLMEMSNEAIDKMYEDYKKEKTDENGYPVVRHSDILMANKTHADTLAKYSGNHDVQNGGAIIMFGDGKTLTDYMSNFKLELTGKVMNEE